MKFLNYRIVTVALLVLVGVWLVLIRLESGGSAKQPFTSPSHVAPSTPNSNPLAIREMRQHPTPGGPITVESELTPRGGCRTFVVSYPSDGFKVYALMQQPSGAKPASGYPTLLLLHGYIPPAEYSTTRTDYQEFMNFYCGQGYLIFKPDFRGNGQSQGAAIGGHFAPDYTYDVLNLLSSLKTLPVANSSQVGVLGHSMGAHVALKAAVISKQIKATILVSGVIGSLTDIVYNWPNAEIPPDAAADRDRKLAIIGSPEQNPSWWHDGSAINYVDAIAGPVQIHYGLDDSVVPLVFSQHLDEALNKSGIPHEFYTYPHTDHQFLNLSSRQQFFSRSLLLLNTNIRDFKVN